VHQNANVYDLSDQYLGVAWLNNLNLLVFGIAYNADGGLTKEDLTKEDTYRFRVHMAVLSGPGPAILGSEDSYRASTTKTTGDEQAAGSLKFYQVMFLTRRVPPTYDIVQGAYERAGLGEIVADAMEGLGGLEWVDITLQ
jgi:hypothetical protein